MLVASDLARILTRMVRRADAGLVTAAARNAATSMNAHQFRRLEDARTLRDLERIPPAVLPAATSAAAVDVAKTAVRAGR